MEIEGIPIHELGDTLKTLHAWIQTAKEIWWLFVFALAIHYATVIRLWWKSGR